MKLIIATLMLAIGCFAEDYWVFLQRNNQLIPEPVFKTDMRPIALDKMCIILGNTGSDPVVFLYKGNCTFSEKSNRWICKEFITSFTKWSREGCN